ncbi:MAG: non-canonical purine NTP pyrophosphatase [Patescibacteria group bacterium]
MKTNKRMSRQQILIGTLNPGKAKEISAWLDSVGFEPVLPVDLGLGDIEETGSTLKENSDLKALYYLQKSGLPTVADDSGFEVDALDGAPGIKSKRWLGEDASWLDLARAIIDRLQNVPSEARTARLHTVMSLALPSGEVHNTEASICGRVPLTLDESLITPGYPYRALLTVDQFNKLYAELTEEEHAAVNQRQRALVELLPELRKLQ